MGNNIKNYAGGIILLFNFYIYEITKFNYEHKYAFCQNKVIKKIKLFKIDARDERTHT